MTLLNDGQTQFSSGLENNILGEHRRSDRSEKSPDRHSRRQGEAV